MTSQSRTFRLRGYVVAAALPFAAVFASESPSARPAKSQPPMDAPVSSPTKPAPAPVPNEPGTTTASYGDWVMRCQRGENAGKPLRVCEVAQTVQVQGQTQPIAQIAFGRIAARDPLDVTIILPLNIGLPSSVRVLADDRDTAGFDIPWRRCLPGGCVAQSAARDDVLTRWRGSGEPGRIVFRNAAGQDVGIPLSFRGLAPALDALAKESSN